MPLPSREGALTRSSSRGGVSCTAELRSAGDQSPQAAESAEKDDVPAPCDTYYPGKRLAEIGARGRSDFTGPLVDRTRSLRRLGGGRVCCSFDGFAWLIDRRRHAVACRGCGHFRGVSSRRRPRGCCRRGGGICLGPSETAGSRGRRRVGPRHRSWGPFGLLLGAFRPVVGERTLRKPPGSRVPRGCPRGSLGRRYWCGARERGRSLRSLVRPTESVCRSPRRPVGPTLRGGGRQHRSDARSICDRVSQWVLLRQPVSSLRVRTRLASGRSLARHVGRSSCGCDQCRGGLRRPLIREPFVSGGALDPAGLTPPKGRVASPRRSLRLCYPHPNWVTVADAG